MKECADYAQPHPQPHPHPQPPSQPPSTTGGPGTGVIATVLILLVGLIALQVMSLQQSAESLKATHASQQKLTSLIQARTEKALSVAQQALVTADASRPDPYTGTDARADEVHRRSERMLEHRALMDDLDHKIALVEARASVKLGALEIPPKSVRDLLAALTRQGIRNDKAILILSLALDHLNPGSTHVQTLSLLRDQQHDVVQ